MIDNKLHLVAVLENGQTYDASFGSIVLPKAGYFAVTIKEYQEDEKKINELEKKKQAAKDFAIDNWEENEKKRWSEKKLKEQYQQDIRISFFAYYLPAPVYIIIFFAIILDLCF